VENLLVGCRIVFGVAAGYDERLPTGKTEFGHELAGTAICVDLRIAFERLSAIGHGNVLRGSFQCHDGIVAETLLRELNVDVNLLALDAAIPDGLTDFKFTPFALSVLVLATQLASLSLGLRNFALGFVTGNDLMLTLLSIVLVRFQFVGRSELNRIGFFTETRAPNAIFVRFTVPFDFRLFLLFSHASEVQVALVLFFRLCLKFDVCRFSVYVAQHLDIGFVAKCYCIDDVAACPIAHTVDYSLGIRLTTPIMTGSAAHSLA
jgi:hypothetical protein